MSGFGADPVSAQSEGEDDPQSRSRRSPAVLGQWTQYSDMFNVLTPGVYSDSSDVHQWSPSRSAASLEPEPRALGFISLQRWSSDHV